MLGQLRRQASVIGSNLFSGQSRNHQSDLDDFNDEEKKANRTGIVEKTNGSSSNAAPSNGSNLNVVSGNKEASNTMTSTMSSYFRAAVHILSEATASASTAASSYADSASNYIHKQYVKPKKYVLQSPDFYG